MMIISRDGDTVEVEKSEHLSVPERQIMLLVRGVDAYESEQVWITKNEARALAAVLLEFARDK